MGEDQTAEQAQKVSAGAVGPVAKLTRPQHRDVCTCAVLTGSIIALQVSDGAAMMIEEEEEAPEVETEEQTNDADFNALKETMQAGFAAFIHPLGQHMGPLGAAYNDLYQTMAGKMQELGEYLSIGCTCPNDGLTL
jgi:hypothetical protein